ncbi:MAG: hypothetical protein A3E78_00885 [Alphaproteobacteria bacterium RIFCSPHIGHO2_12_FULL_63_12]|nr:MAG: hypothetical protein A3E78_00885 [Alphaproteobacteria bacterium RIFCSPHIGHO2_12_FULL_63_12]
MKLRPYQLIQVEKVFEKCSEDLMPTIIVSATGTGKGAAAAELARRVLPMRTLLLAHTEELCSQLRGHCRTWAGVEAAVEKAESRADLGEPDLFGSEAPPIVVGSIQTMIRRKERFPADYFGLVVCDEAHISLSPGWQSVLRYFDPHARIVGITASPSRSDQREMGSYYKSIADEYGLVRAISEGYLVPLKTQTVPISVSLAGVKTTDGDLDEIQLDRAIRPYLKEAAHALKQYAPQRRTIAFLPLIDTSREFVKCCREVGLEAAHVDGTSEDRAELQDKLRRGALNVLSNAQLLSVGVDIPQADCVLVLRPTKSFVFYSQAIGRITRTLPGVIDGLETPEARKKAIAGSLKPNALILDMIWLHEKHNIVRPSSLVAAAADHVEVMTKLAETECKPQDLDQLAQRALDLVLVQREGSLRKELEANKHKGARLMDAIEFALAIKNEKLSDKSAQSEMPWGKDAPSEKQLSALANWGFDPHSIRNKGHASELLDAVFKRKDGGLASPKQIKFLRAQKYPNPEKATYEEASRFMDAKLKRFAQIAKYRKK